MLAIVFFRIPSFKSFFQPSIFHSGVLLIGNAPVRQVKVLSPTDILTRFFGVLCPDFLRKIFKTRRVLPKLKFAEFPKQDQAELNQKLIPFVPFSHIHFSHPIF